MVWSNLFGPLKDDGSLLEKGVDNLKLRPANPVLRIIIIQPHRTKFYFMDNGASLVFAVSNLGHIHEYGLSINDGDFKTLDRITPAHLYS